MLLSSIKKLSDKRKKTKNPDGTPSKSVYGGVGLGHVHNDGETKEPEVATGGDADGGGE